MSCSSGGGGGGGTAQGFNPREPAQQGLTGEEIINQFKKGSVKSQFPKEYLSKARTIARAAEHSYENNEGEVISWTLAAIVDVKMIFTTELKEGAEVYYEYLE